MVCSSQVSPSAFGHLEPAELLRHFSCDGPNEPIVNLCSAPSPQCEASNNQTRRQATAHCRASGRESPQSGHGHGGEGRAMVSAHWPGVGRLCVSSFPGTQSWVTSWWTCRGEVAHTDTTVCRARHWHTVLCRTVVLGLPTGSRLTGGRDHTALGALKNTSLRLVTHPS